MKKHLLIGVFFLTLVSCQYLNSLSSDKKLTKEIKAKFKSKVTDLTKLNSFEWD